MFRYERPQAGRQRQFWQLGCELFGNLPPARDAELVQMVLYLFEELGLKDLRTIINSVGCNGCRPAYIEVIQEYFHQTLEPLCDECKRRVKKNPLRIFDCKVDTCHSVSEGAPPIDKYLCDGCNLHMEEFLGYLDRLVIPYEVNPRLVRGLDYYTRTVFEIIDSRLGAKDALAAGGRYDDLVEDFGGLPTPALGFAAGIERVILSLRRLGLDDDTEGGVELYISAISDDAIETVLRIGRDLRQSGIKTRTGYMERSVKREVRLAGRLGVRFLFIIGSDELASGMIKPRDILEHRELEEISIDRIVEWSKEALGR
jgi:histidyl-tRNA synthetase